MNPPKTHDHIINARLRKIFALGKSDANLVETLEEIDSLPGFLPFKIGDILISRQLYQVIPSVLRPKSSNPLWQTALNVEEGEPFIATDAVLEGPNSLFAVVAINVQEFPDLLLQWSRKMNSPSVVIGNLKGLVMIASPLTSFT